MQNETPKVVSSLEELIGNTPLLEVKWPNVPARLLFKLEGFNPGGSSKDRSAIEMIDAAEREGLLKPGGTIIEPTSGNTGVGLAIVAKERGYNCIFVVTNKVSAEKVDLLKAYGAQVVVCDVAVAPEDPNSYYSTAERLTKETPNAFRPDQYSNQNNPLAHYKTTGPEIWDQTDGKITYFVAGMGTGGTISGVARYLKEQNPDVKIVGADPTNSVYSGGTGRPYLTEGVGEDFWPTTFDPSLVDEMVPVSDHDAFAMTRKLAEERAILIGGSGAMAVVAAISLEDRLTPEDVVVILIPDTGRGYLSKIFNDDWMVKHGFLDRPQTSGAKLRDLFSDRELNEHSIIYVNPESTIRDAIEVMQRFDVSQVPVAKNQPPFAAAEIIGSLDELEVMRMVRNDSSVLERPVSEIMDQPLKQVGTGEDLERALNDLDSDNAMLVLDKGFPVGVVTRSDVLEYFTKSTNVEPLGLER